MCCVILRRRQGVSTATRRLIASMRCKVLRFLHVTCPSLHMPMGKAVRLQHEMQCSAHSSYYADAAGRDAVLSVTVKALRCTVHWRCTSSHCPSQAHPNMRVKCWSGAWSWQAAHRAPCLVLPAQGVSCTLQACCAVLHIPSSKEQMTANTGQGPGAGRGLTGRHTACAQVALSAQGLSCTLQVCCAVLHNPSSIQQMRPHCQWSAALEPAGGSQGTTQCTVRGPCSKTNTLCNRMQQCVAWKRVCCCAATALHQNTALQCFSGTRKAHTAAHKRLR